MLGGSIKIMHVTHEQALHLVLKVKCFPDSESFTQKGNY